MKSPANLSFYDAHPGVASLREEVLSGLVSRPRAIPPKFFYDEEGSRLFDAICELPEYYPTRTETTMLERVAGEIAELAGPQTMLVELGSGASKKVRLLLDTLRPTAYMAIDISKDFLLQSTRQLAGDYDWLPIHAVCADFSQELELPEFHHECRKLAFFPGSSIGNFDPLEAAAFLRRLGHFLGPDGALLIGVDLKKNPSVLHAAYNDAQGVTAAFNLNLLSRIQNELNCDIDPSSFDHQAFYNGALGRIEMHLVSRHAQRLRIGDRVFELAAGETIHTENSYKYSLEEFDALARQAGYHTVRAWTDDQRLFSIHYLELDAVAGD
jgi:dimethylhistidine N-methyltransferase